MILGHRVERFADWFSVVGGLAAFAGRAVREDSPTGSAVALQAGNSRLSGAGRQDVGVHSPSAPGHGVGAAVESALAGMVGERLRYIGRATDLVWVGIGRDVDVPRRGGGTRVLAEHAMHLQCPWRLTLLGTPLVGSWDLHRPTGSNEWADGELAQGEAAFDPVAAQLSSDGGNREHSVEVLVGDDWGGVSVEFTGGLVLDVLPVTTAADECWRYFRPGEDDDHFVVFETPEAPRPL